MQKQESTSSLNCELDPIDSQIDLAATTSGSNTVISLESELSAYIRWALRKSNSGEYSTHKAMKLLEKAWKAQKALWRLRKQELYASTEAKFVAADRE
jgi:hypothetical protein